MSIFRAYDIRGVYGETLTNGITEDIGKALGTFMHNKKLGETVVVGNDVRSSSPSLSVALRKGLAITGVKVLNAGTTSFGVALFTGMREKSVTAYITASHNPPEWNGVKFFGPDCIGFFEEDNKEIEHIVSSRDFHKGDPQKEQKVDYKDEYKEFLRERFRINRPLRVVLDCGNGATSLVVPKLFKLLGFDVIELFCEVDPQFPGRGPDVVEGSCGHLREAVIREGADMGLALDGDGDRIAVVDEQGRFISPDMLALILGREMLKGRPGKVICNVDCSMLMERLLEPLGAEVIRIPVGHTFMMQHAKRHNAIFGVETSQHYVFPSFLPFDDGVVAGLKIAEMVSLSGRPLSSFFNGLSPLPRKTKALPCPDERKKDVMKMVERELAKEYEVDTIDGVRISPDGGWGLIRPSNTSPVIRITAEGETPAAMKNIYTKISKVLQGLI